MPKIPAPKPPAMKKPPKLPTPKKKEQIRPLFPLPSPTSWSLRIKELFNLSNEDMPHDTQELNAILAKMSEADRLALVGVLRSFVENLKG